MAQFRRPPRRLGLSVGAAVAGAVLGAFCLLGIPGETGAQADKSKDFAPGFGLLYGEGRTNEENARVKRVGFTSRRLREDNRIGSLALVGEEHFDGVPVDILDPNLSKEEVELRYQALFVEIKRYFPLGGPFHVYWGLRGGFTRIRGRIRPDGGQLSKEFEVDGLAPLGLLALPLAIENPGFLLLAFLDGTSFGLTLDIVPNRSWLDIQLGTALIPDYRDAQVALDERIVVTRVLQLVVVF